MPLCDCDPKFSHQVLFEPQQRSEQQRNQMRQKAMEQIVKMQQRGAAVPLTESLSLLSPHTSSPTSKSRSSRTQSPFNNAFAFQIAFQPCQKNRLELYFFHGFTHSCFLSSHHSFVCTQHSPNKGSSWRLIRITTWSRRLSAALITSKSATALLDSHRSSIASAA